MKRRLSHFLILLIVLPALLWTAVAYAEDPWDFPTVYSASTEAAVAAKVEQLANECRASGAEGDFEIAVWMHDWLIYNADYDESLTIYGADGVLLDGTGVCQSYTLAYELLLNAMGIENIRVTSVNMEPSHTWNLVKMEGSWYHVDCTWDDPVDDDPNTMGGYENHSYFGLSDALMSRDHSWKAVDYACNSNDCNYYIRTGEYCVVSNQEEVNAAIAEQLAKGNTEIKLYNIATDGFDLESSLADWQENELWKYSCSGYSYSGGSYSLTLNITDYDPTVASINISQFEDAIKAGATTINVYDQGNTFDPAQLYSRVLDASKYLAPKYNCYVEDGYRISSANYIIVNVTYLSESTLPEPYAYSNSGVNFIKDFSMEGIAPSDYEGQRVIWLFVHGAQNYDYDSVFHTLCSLSAGSDILEKADVEIVFCGLNLGSLPDQQSLMTHFYDQIPNMDIAFLTTSDDNCFFSVLGSFGYEGSFSLPVIFLQDTDGSLVYCSTGPVDEPDRLIATAVDGQLPVVYNNILVLPAGLTAIEASAFEGSTAFEEVRFDGENVTSIGANAFKNCDSLKRITIPDSVSSIADNAFSGCTGLTIYSGKDSLARSYASAHGFDWKEAK